MEFSLPKYMRYDFLITVLSSLLIGFWFYYTYMYISAETKLDLSITLLIGVPALIYGIGQMYNNYSNEMELFKLESFVNKKEAIEKLKQKQIIGTDEEASLNYYLRGEINTLIDTKSSKDTKK